jgi:hypothetical protein
MTIFFKEESVIQQFRKRHINWWIQTARMFEQAVTTLLRGSRYNSKFLVLVRLHYACTKQRLSLQYLQSTIPTSFQFLTCSFTENQRKVVAPQQTYHLL